MRASRFLIGSAGAALLAAALGIGGFADVALAHHGVTGWTARCVDDGSTITYTYTVTFPDEGWSDGAGTAMVTSTRLSFAPASLQPGQSATATEQTSSADLPPDSIGVTLTWENGHSWTESVQASKPADCIPDTSTTTSTSTTTAPPTTTTTTTETPTTTTEPSSTTTEPSSTTTEPSSTTTEPSSTTTEPSSTTTEPDDTTTTTATTPTTAPSTSTTAVLVTVVTQPSTTSTAVQVLPPGATSPTTTTPAAPTSTPELPVTGGSTTPIVLTAGTLLGLGAVLAAVRRRGQITG